MYAHAQCERCGDSTIRAETATRAFCASCASIASTGARSSSELLFTLASAAHHERTTAEDLASLASLARSGAERVSVTPLLAFKSVASLAPPRPRPPRVAAPLLAAALVLLAGSAVALAWHASQLDRSAEESAGAKAEEPRKAEPSIALAPRAPEPLAPPLAPEPEPAALAPRAEALAPQPLDPRPAARTPRATAPRASAPAPAVEGDLLDDLFGPPRAPAAVSSAPRVPTRREVSLAMRALEHEVAMCGGASGAMVTTRVTFTGASGRVAHAEVVDASVPPAVRSCIVRAVRGAELPEFAQDTFTVAYPFRL